MVAPLLFIASGLYQADQVNHCVQTVVDTVSGISFDLRNHERYECSQTEACKSTRVAALLHAFFYNMWCVCVCACACVCLCVFASVCVYVCVRVSQPF